MNTTKIKVVLAGNPNSGKSTLFNALTGLRQKVGNYPGITVEKKTGICNLDTNLLAEITDVPGTYSLYPKSIDERVAQLVICNKKDKDYPEVTVVVADATNLRRSIFLITQIIDLKMRVVLALNMVDIATKKGIIVDVNLLSQELGIPVAAINARKGKGLDTLKETIIHSIDKKPQSPFLEITKLFKGVIEQANKIRGTENNFASFMALCKQKLSGEIDNRCALNQLCKKEEIIPERAQAKETVNRYTQIDKVIKATVKQGKPIGKYVLTKKIDDVLIHPIFGYVVFLAVLFLIFQVSL